MRELSTEEAQKRLEEVCVKSSTWQKGSGCIYRIYKVPAGFNTLVLPLNFQILFIDPDGYMIISEVIPK